MRHANLKWISISLTMLALCSLARDGSAGTYRTITIDGSFFDWTGVPVVATATNGTSGTTLDLASLSIANDASNIYFLITYNQPVNPNSGDGTNVYLAFDTDNHPATGFNVFGLNLIGSEVGWQNDGPFVQSNGVFNTGGTITGGTALIAPFNSVTTTQEYAISRFATYAASGQPVFPGNTFTVAVYANPTPTTDLLGPVQYTCATNVPPGTYKTITIAGTTFADWAGVPTLAWLPPGTSGTNLDLASLSMANDSSNLYLLLTYNTPVNPNAGPSVFLAVDNDSNPNTGFNVFGLGLIGSEVGWENDFPFAQSNGVFNTGGGITGGNASIAPFYSVTTTQEYAISRSATFTATGLPIFPNNVFNLMAYANPTPNLDYLGPVSYAFATNSLPGTYAHITIDGDYSDWTNVPVLFTGTPYDGLPTGVRTIQMANDENYLYIRLTYFMDENPNAGDGVYLAIDTDNNLATGFDVYGFGLIGSEVGWQNDSPFAQSNGVFNAGSITGGTALIAPYDSFTSAQEYALPLSATYTATGAPVFPGPGSTINMLVYTTDGSIIDVSGPVQYTFVAGPPAPFRILSIARGATNNITLTWTAPGGTTNVVQAKTGNYSTNGFVTISSPIINPGSGTVGVTNQYTESLALTNKPARFYRISQTP
jgi:hypothetical protein